MFFHSLGDFNLLEKAIEDGSFLHVPTHFQASVLFGFSVVSSIHKTELSSTNFLCQLIVADLANFIVGLQHKGFNCLLI